MLTPFPSIKPYAEHQLSVDDVHTLYLEESGNPEGLPILFVHGGPGAGTCPHQRCFFEPEIYRIILFDQRGAGHSKPHAELTQNTTQHLVDDMEKIREYLQIDEWILCGGSWGSLLSLVYAQTHPERVMGLILRSIFLGSRENIDWFLTTNAPKVFPEYWEEFVKIIPEDEHDDVLSAYYKRLTGNDDLTRMAAAKSWAIFEGSCASLFPSPKQIEHCREPFFANALARLESHYLINQCFIESQQILDNMYRIEDKPGIIVHGRYDMVCPFANAWQLHQRWPASELKIIRCAGHSASEPAMVDALVHATREMAKLFLR